jgi:hypothetical protein
MEIAGTKFKKPTARLVAEDAFHETWRISCYWYGCAHDWDVQVGKGLASQYFAHPSRCPSCNKACVYALTRGKLKKRKKGSTTPSLFDESDLPDTKKSKKKKKADQKDAKH